MQYVQLHICDLHFFLIIYTETNKTPVISSLERHSRNLARAIICGEEEEEEGGGDVYNLSMHAPRRLAFCHPVTSLILRRCKGEDGYI